MPLPLAGIRVIEFAHMVMGPSCGMTVPGSTDSEPDSGYLRLEQQIEVKINLSPENYRQFLETMTEDQ